MKDTLNKTVKKTGSADPARTEQSAGAAGSGLAPKPKANATPGARTAPRAAANTAARAGTGPAAKAPVRAPAKAAPAPKGKARPAQHAAEAGSAETAGRQAVKAADSHANALAAESGVAGSADKMKTSVVSKVSEVMTKTTKPNTAPSEVRLLSEAEILAMSEKDYMNPAQLAFFKARLQQLERDLLKNAGETTEHLRETVLVPDPADRATIEEEHALELRTRDRERKLLKKVQQSIAAIDGGDYGWCEETGEPIGIPRLIARPTATLSLEAQQRRELKQKLYGD
jgi:DnaK suppressor protein